MHVTCALYAFAPCCARSRPRLHVIFAAYAIAARDREKNKLSEKQEAAAVAAIMAAHHADHAITGASVGEAFYKLTLDFPAWHAMMRDGRMLDRDFTQREATTIFVKVWPCINWASTCALSRSRVPEAAA